MRNAQFVEKPTNTSNNFKGLISIAQILHAGNCIYTKHTKVC